MWTMFHEVHGALEYDKMAARSREHEYWSPTYCGGGMRVISFLVRMHALRVRRSLLNKVDLHARNLVPGKTEVHRSSRTLSLARFSSENYELTNSEEIQELMTVYIKTGATHG